MRINNNMLAINTHRQMGGVALAQGKSMEKLSSGFRINRAGDDAAGLAISEKMRAQIRGLNTAAKNAQDGISLIQTAEGALQEVHSMLNRMVELATQSANGTFDDAVDRKNLEAEVTALKGEIDRISESTNFNGIKLLDGSIKSKELKLGSGNGSGAKSFTIKGGNLAPDAANVFKFKTKNDSAAQKDTTLALNVDVPGVSFEIVEASTTLEGTETKGSITYRAKIDSAPLDTEAKKKAAAQFEGMTVTVEHGTLTQNKDDVSVAYNTVKGSGLKLQVGDTSDSYQRVEVTVGKMSSEALNIANISVADQSKAGDAIKNIKDAINTVSSARGDLGALQNRLEHTIANINTTAENITASESRIRDVDMAKEMVELTKSNILQQAAQAMLAQANQAPQGVLQLLR